MSKYLSILLISLIESYNQKREELNRFKTTGCSLPCVAWTQHLHSGLQQNQEGIRTYQISEIFMHFRMPHIYFIFLSRKLLGFDREEGEGSLNAAFSDQPDQANFDAVFPFLVCLQNTEVGNICFLNLCSHLSCKQQAARDSKSVVKSVFLFKPKKYLKRVLCIIIIFS